MVDELNERYTKLFAKRDTLTKDKDEVLSTIDFLNQKMNDELQVTWKIVSKYCGEIFSTLLPNA